MDQENIAEVKRACDNLYQALRSFRQEPDELHLVAIVKAAQVVESAHFKPVLFRKRYVGVQVVNQKCLVPKSPEALIELPHS